MASPRDPVADLREIAFLLERAREPTYRVRAFRNAADRRRGARRRTSSRRASPTGTLGKVKGIGETTARCVTESLRGEVPVYLRGLQATDESPLGRRHGGGARARCAVTATRHSDWSDGGSPIREMAETARALGHEYMVLTDHSPA